MYMRYLLACLFAALLVPASLVMASDKCASKFTESIEGGVEAQEEQEICQGKLNPVDLTVPANYMGDPDDYMGDLADYDPDVEDGEDIDEDDEDSQE